jgi:hypothetical protein
MSTAYGTITELLSFLRQLQHPSFNHTLTYFNSSISTSAAITMWRVPKGAGLPGLVYTSTCNQSIATRKGGDTFLFPVNMVHKTQSNSNRDLLVVCSQTSSCSPPSLYPFKVKVESNGNVTYASPHRSNRPIALY